MNSKIPEFQIFTLPNGLRCVLKRVKSAVVHCAVTVNTGSRDELPGEEGMAHLTEHTIFKGTRRRRAYHVNCRLENLGGELNAFTTKEDTTVHATTLRGDFSKAAELLADVVFHSVFPDREVEKEKAVIIDEINTYKDIPADMIYDDFEDMIFAGSTLGHNILGTRNSIARLHSNDIRDFVLRTYNTDQMVFSVIGNISEKSFRSVAERYFSDAEPRPRSFSRLAPPAYRSFEKVANKHNHQTNCIMGNRAYSLDDGRRLPLALLVNILGGPSANSMLNVSLREKYGLTYNIEAAYTPFSDSGVASIYFSCDKDNTDRCRELIDRQLRELREKPLSARRLSMAKKQYIGQMAISMESNESYMLGVGKSLLIYDEIESMKRIYERVEAIGAGQLRDIAAEIFTDMSTLIYR